MRRVLQNGKKIKSYKIHISCIQLHVRTNKKIHDKIIHRNSGNVNLKYFQQMWERHDITTKGVNNFIKLLSGY